MGAKCEARLIESIFQTRSRAIAGRSNLMITHGMYLYIMTDEEQAQRLAASAIKEGICRSAGWYMKDK
jgi:hypothetical protein